MQSLFGGGELGLLGGGGSGGGGGGDTGTLKEDGSVAWNSSTLAPEDVYSASHFALITAYQDIKTRLACLERENTSIKRKLKMYEIKVSLCVALHVPTPHPPPRTHYRGRLSRPCRHQTGRSPVWTVARLRRLADLLGVFEEGEEAAHSAVALSVFIEGSEIVHKDERGESFWRALIRGWRRDKHRYSGKRLSGNLC